MQDRARITSYAAERARLLFGGFLKGQAIDPDTFVATVTVTLARFPEEVIRAVTDPATGIVQNEEWLPSVRKVRLACEDAWEPIKQAELRRKRVAEQLAERERWEAKGRESLESDLKGGFGP